MRDQELVRRFLLGKLREEKAERVERRLLEENELFDLCEAVEAELLEAAVRGELAPAERERVLQRLASSPQGRARLALARSLAAEADRQRTGTQALPAPIPFRRRPAFAGRPAVRWAVAAGLAVLLGGTWFLVEKTGPEREVQTARQEQASEPPVHRGPQEIPRKRPAPTVAAPVEPTPAPQEPAPAAPERVAEERTPEVPVTGPVTAVLELSLLTFRSEGNLPVPEVQVSNETDVVELRVDVTDEELNTYDVLIKSGRVEVWRRTVEPRSMDGGAFLVLAVPAEDLPPGTYQVEIYESSAEDPLTVQRIEVVDGR